MMSKTLAPLRKVVDIVLVPHSAPAKTSKGREYTAHWSETVEILECGHTRTPKPNAHLGGTDVGEAKSRRCEECAYVEHRINCRCKCHELGGKRSCPCANE